jgi:RimJ/RimL family protein N-acetyltransferase
MNQTLTAVPPPIEARKLGPNETNEVYLSPFWSGKGSPFPDSTIPYLFARTKEDRLLRRIFPGEEEITLPQFIEKLSRWPLVIGFSKADSDVMGYAFLSEYGNPKPWTKANIGYCFLRKYWGRPEIRDLTRIALDWFFNKEGVAILYGTLLPSNRLAVQFFREHYFHEIGRLPLFFMTGRGPEEAMLVYLMREEFLRHFGTRFGKVET